MPQSLGQPHGQQSTIPCRSLTSQSLWYIDSNPVLTYLAIFMEDMKSKLSPVFDWKTIENRRKSKLRNKKIPTWRHTFVCLSSTSQDIIPDSQERAQLQIAGLGERRISLSAYADAHDICFDQCEHFPKLSTVVVLNLCEYLKVERRC